MTAREMEKRLLELSTAYGRSRDERLRDEYRALHARWVAAK